MLYCTKWNNSSNQCESCEVGYKLDGSNVCVLLSPAIPKMCIGNDNTECIKCSRGYVYDDVNNRCYHAYTFLKGKNCLYGYMDTGVFKC